MKKYDVSIVGAGIAGCVFAAHPDNSDKEIIIVEQSLAENKTIVGELLQPGGLNLLKEMQLDFLTEGIDEQEIHGYAMYRGEEEFTIPYPVSGDVKKGRAFHYHKLIEKVRNYIKNLNNVTLIEGRVKSLIENNNKVEGFIFKDKATKEEVTIQSHLTIVSDGPMSRFREQIAEPNKIISSFFMGYGLKNVKLPYPGHGHMILTGDVPILVYPNSSDEVRILIDYPSSKPPKMDQALTDKLTTYVNDLPEALKEPYLTAIKNDRLIVMPNHKMKAVPHKVEGVVLLGDSLNMRHPLTGGGMSAVFSDVKVLTQSIKNIDKENSNDWTQALKTYYVDRTEGTQTINILANALYKVMSNDNLKNATFNYLKKGGEKAEGPVSIMGALNKNKNYLLKHFINVAYDGATTLDVSVPEKIKMVKDATNIIYPLIKEEKKNVPAI